MAQEPPTIHFLSAPRVLRSRRYCRFYRRERERGAYLVLDNGVVDIGEPLPPTDLARAVRLVCADELVLPDVLHQGRATMRLTGRAATQLRGLNESGLRFCVVAQGEDSSEWKRCLEWALSRPYADTIGLPSPEYRNRSTNLPFDRVAATRYINDQGLWQDGRPYHLFGVHDSGHLELRQQRRYSWIRSVDTSAPVVLGALGTSIESARGYRKATTPIDNIGPIRPELFPIIVKNITVFRTAAGDGTIIPHGKEGNK